MKLKYIQITYLDGTRQSFSYTTQKAFDKAVKIYKAELTANKIKGIYASNHNNYEIPI